MNLDPKWMKGFHRRGLALLALNRNIEAKDVYEEALKLWPHEKLLKYSLKKVTIPVCFYKFVIPIPKCYHESGIAVDRGASLL